MSNTTHGATRAKLLENGYVPVAANRESGFLASEEPAAVLVAPTSDCKLEDFRKRQMVVLAVIARDSRIRAEIMKVLAAYGIGKSVYRVGSDGTEMYFVRFDSLTPMTITTNPATGEHEPAFAILSHAPVNPREFTTSALVRLDGKWVNGDLLATPREKLPGLNSGQLDAIFKDVTDAIYKCAPKAEYVPPPVDPRIRAKRLALEAELAKRTDDAIWREVEGRLRSVSGMGATSWEKAAATARANSDDVRIATYDAIVAERAEAELRALPYSARRARHASL
jgi:hypothetical protein